MECEWIAACVKIGWVVSGWGEGTAYHVGVTPRGRAEDVGIEIGDDEVVKINIGMAGLGSGSTEVVRDGSRVCSWSASCEWRTISDGGDGGRRHDDGKGVVKKEGNGKTVAPG